MTGTLLTTGTPVIGTPSNSRDPKSGKTPATEKDDGTRMTTVIISSGATASRKKSRTSITYY
jgi:hypothetical protein